MSAVALAGPIPAPPFCQYAKGPCVRPNLAPVDRPRVFFAYPGRPELISSAIEAAAASLRKSVPEAEWFTWRDMNPNGQILLCTICESIRGAKVVAADVTQLNENVLFEIGFAIGLGLPVVPLRDTSLASEDRVFRELGVLDTLGYVEFTNSTQLVEGLTDALTRGPVVTLPTEIDATQPVFLMRSPVVVDGALALESALKKAKLRYRSFDPRETPRLSLLEMYRQVAASAGVVSEMLAPNRNQAAHNARCAFASGMAVAMGKAVLMLQEQIEPQAPALDFRDIAQTYTNASNVPGLARGFFDQVVEFIQSPVSAKERARDTPLIQIDLGDIAAENEILGLRAYFLPTGPSSQAEKGHARLVTGRKGSGKTAIFYRVRDAVHRGRDTLVMEMKPEGAQFARFKEVVLDRLGAGLQEHTHSLRSGST